MQKESFISMFWVQNLWFFKILPCDIFLQIMIGKHDGVAVMKNGDIF